MKITFCIAVILAASLGFACARDDVKPANSASMLQPSPPANAPVPKDGNYNAKGRVTKIDLDLGSVELDHGDIPGVMPPMKMEFYVSDKSLLNGLNVNDQVDFVLEYKYPTETVVGITKVP